VRECSIPRFKPCARGRLPGTSQMDQKPSGTGYAIWLMPGGQTKRHLTQRIHALSRRFSSPRFEPHVTLISGITRPEQEALSQSAALARRLQPFKIRLAQVGFLDEYFRCLFLRVIPTDALRGAHQMAREVFGLTRQPAYMPHLSLLYGKLSMDTKKRFALRPSIDASFQVSRIHLYSVDGPPANWQPAGTFSLRQLPRHLLESVAVKQRLRSETPSKRLE